MSTFARVKIEDADKMSELAANRGLEHNILPFPGQRFSDWVTFQFTNARGKRAFENLAAQNGVTVDGQQLVARMLDNVLAGEHPSKVVEDILEARRKLCNVTPGMARHAGAGRIKYRCKACGLTIPVYPGGYPNSCPQCGGTLEEPKDESVGTAYNGGTILTFYDSQGELRFSTLENVLIDPTSDGRIQRLIQFAESAPVDSELVDLLEKYRGSLEDLYQHVVSNFTLVPT